MPEYGKTEGHVYREIKAKEAVVIAAKKRQTFVPDGKRTSITALTSAVLLDRALASLQENPVKTLEDRTEYRNGLDFILTNYPKVRETVSEEKRLVYDTIIELNKAAEEDANKVTVNVYVDPEVVQKTRLQRLKEVRELQKKPLYERIDTYKYFIGVVESGAKELADKHKKQEKTEEIVK